MTPGAAANPDSPASEGDARIGLGVDVGGTNIKLGLVALDTGELVGDSLYIPTPQPATPDAVASAITDAVGTMDWSGPVGVAIPSVIHKGVARTAANIDPEWIGCDVEELFGRHLPGRTVTLLNDADAAGITEIHFGSAKGVEGLVILLTLGTGIGSAFLFDGQLIPNTEFGHFFVPHISTGVYDEAEHYASGAVRAVRGLSFEEWAPHLSNVLRQMENLLWPKLFVLGGGISEAADQWVPMLENRTPVAPATRLNDAGIVGAAIYADASA